MSDIVQTVLEWNSTRVFLILLLGATTLSAGLSAWKVWATWGRKESAAMFWAMALAGVAIGCVFRLWASTYTINQPIAFPVAWRSIVAITAESIPSIFTLLYTGQYIKGGWFKGQNGSRMVVLTDESKPRQE